MNRFVDIEATVDDSEEGDDSEEEREAIERDLEELTYDETDPNALNSLIATMNACVDLDEDQEFEGFLDGILRRSNQEEGASPLQVSLASDPDGWFVAAQPGSDDYPLWRVDCRIGLEDIAVMAIYRMASNGHAIRSAFTRGAVRGHIYVECQMNRTVQHLLSKITGLKSFQGGLKMKCIPHKDQTKILTMKNILNNVERHSWVRIRRGLYQGDEGLVLDVHDWGVTVLLVPRIGPVNISKKRKASTVRPVPCLVREDSESSTASGIGKDVTIEHGLICKAFDMASVTPNASDMPFQMFQEFMRSGHPTFKHVNLIRPREWQVNVDDAIFNIASAEYGVVKVVMDEGVEAAMSEGRLVFIPWKLLQKDVQVGDQVTVTAGAKTGTSGWVVAVRANIATVAAVKCEGTVKGNDDDVEHVEVYVNYLTSVLSHPIATPRDNKVQHGEQSRNPQHRTHPWSGIEVVISQNQHPMKGQTGVVEDVIQSRTTTGSPRIVMRIISYDPSMPYKTVTIDSDAVTTRKLHHPLRSVNKANSSDYRLSDALQDGRPAKGQTPEPENKEYDTTPAWDPSALPPGFDSTGPGAASGSHMVAHPFAHPFKNPALAGATVKAYVNNNTTGGSSKAKETTLHIDQSNGACALRTKRYHEWHSISFDSVTPKYPSPTHDNGLILIIKGEYTGMYGRRVGHTRRDGIAYMVLELVTIQEGKADTLTGTIVELAAEDMCVVDEQASQKKLNVDLMKNSRLKHQTQTKNRF